MIRHVVMFRWSDSVTADHVRAAGTALDALPGLIPEIAAYEHGPDLGLAATNADYAIVGDFESAADFGTYRDHPDHQKFIAEYIADFVIERTAVQFPLD